jgi:protein-tyrosine phosphatase
LIDLHCHLLPGLDDGARSLSEALGIARTMVLDGVERVAVTPHVRADWRISAGEMEAALERLRHAIEAAGIPLDVLPGAEIALDVLPRLAQEERARFGLAGNPRLLLLEFPTLGWPLALPDLVLELRCEGIVPVLAHPERNPEVQEQPQRLEPLVRAGAVVQLTAASVDGRLGARPRRAARALLERGLAHALASDAHSPGVRQAGLSAAARSLGDDALARWLTCDVPAALLAGDALPARPDSSRLLVRLLRRR